MSSDTVMSDAHPDIVNIVDDDEGQLIRHFVVAVDFGTTFSSVAYVAYTQEHQRRTLDLSNIEMVDEYPYWEYSNNPVTDVPTEIWYSNPGQRGDGTNSFHNQTQTMDHGTVDEEDESESDSESEQTMKRPGAPPVPTNSSLALPPFWGYGIHRQVQIADVFDASKRIARFKLLLDDSPETEKARIRLEETCAGLKKKGLITINTDLIAHYLEQLFKHVHERLTETEEEGYSVQSKVEFVLCVPAIWKAKACRQMHTAMTTAIENSKFGSLQRNSIDDLFIVSEPEAAATFAVKSKKIKLKVGQTVLILDAGGATVDAATYTVDRTLPLRFKTEAVELGGALCGSSYINERFEDLLVKRLSNEHYLARPGEDMSRVIDRLVVEFERSHKRALDKMFPDELEAYYLPVYGLRANKKSHFSPNKMRLSRKEIRELFMPSAMQVAQVMKDQIEAALGKSDPRKVTQVILMGGYGESKSLSAHLKQVLSEEPKYQAIQLVCPKFMSTAVSQGAVLRALAKEEGPDRILQSSYGFLRSEPYMKREEWKEAHGQQEKWRDPIDNMDYIIDAIQWILHKGTKLAAETRIEIEVEYTFKDDGSRWLCAETLYVSDQYPVENGKPQFKERESHYRWDHDKNLDAERAGEVSLDLTHLKDSRHLKGTGMVKRISPHGRLAYWKVLATLSVVVNGRNLRYEVRLRNESSDAKPQAIGQQSLAPAFKPGTE